MLDGRLEVIQRSWKGLQIPFPVPFPVSVQADVHMGMFDLYPTLKKYER